MKQIIYAYSQEASKYGFCFGLRLACLQNPGPATLRRELGIYRNQHVLLDDEMVVLRAAKAACPNHKV